MLKWIFAAIGVVVLSAVISITHGLLDEASYRGPHDAVAYERDRQIEAQYEPVSLVSLLATPEHYDGRKVRVSGFVTLEHEGTGLHLDESAYEAGLRKNAVWLDRPRWLTATATRRLDRRYGEVAGTFAASEHGAYGAYSGTLTQVRRIRPTFTRSEYVRQRSQERDEVMMAHLFSVPFLTLVGWMALAVLWVLTRRGSQR